MISTAVAYYRTSSATNVGEDKDSRKRQTEAVQSYARQHNLQIMNEFYDEAVRGSDPVASRPGFADMLTFISTNNVQTILVESASRFARDLAVQLTGHDYLKKNGITLIPVDAPTHFTDDTPTAIMVRQILGAVSEFEKSSLVEKLKKARDRKRQETGRCGGRKPVPSEHRSIARSFHLQHYSLRQISKELTLRGHLSPSGRSYGPQSIKVMLKGFQQ